jgi:hypothetical protein
VLDFIFPDNMRGGGDGNRLSWPGAPNGTMTNGAVRSLGADYVERLGALVAAMDDEHGYFGGGAAAR